MSSAEEIDVMIRAAELAVIRFAIEYCEVPESQAATDGSYGSLSAAVATLQELKAAPHAGADGSCPNYGSTLDPCPPGCASGTCVVNTCICSRTVKQYCTSSECHGGADVPQWFNRTWVDVRTSDTVRLLGTENTAYVRHAVHHGWHVDPRSSEYRPVAMEWTAVHVELTAGQQHDAAVLGVLDMDPTKPILIQLTQSEVDAIELLGGWPNRVGMTMTEVPKP